MLPLTPTESASLDALANHLGVKSKDLLVLINFESSWNPKARNPITGARGLIQFMPDTARALGYLGADDLVNRFPTRKEQLDGPVRQYLSRLKPYNGTAQNLFMAVFHPDYRNVSISKPFDTYTLRDNPGIRTPLDYVKKAYAVAGMRYAAPISGILLLVAAGMYFLLRK